MLYLQDVSETDSDFVYDKVKKSSKAIDSESEEDRPSSRASSRAQKVHTLDDSEDDLEIVEPDTGKKDEKEKDEFDISSSDDGGLFNKVGAASKEMKQRL